MRVLAIFVLIFGIGCKTSTVTPSSAVVAEPARSNQGVEAAISPHEETAVPTEMRGIWITRFSWRNEAELMAMLDHVAEVGFNAVFFQVRGNFDAYYASRLEPWAERLTGQLGQDPGWDPLGAVVERGHELGLQVHAYMNAYPFWRGPNPPQSADIPHPLELHPDWLVVDESGQPMALNDIYVFASPGHPEVRDHIRAVAVDIASRYDIDGLHLDYIRYPEPQYSHDIQSTARFARIANEMSWSDWQAEQVGLLVESIYRSVDVPLTAAVWGIYEDAFGWGRVSEGRHDYYQDSHGWLANARIDGIVPMIYWSVKEEGERLDFSALLEHHLLGRAGRHVYAGIGGEHITIDEVLECIEESRMQVADGVVLFDYSLFAEGLERLSTGPFAEPAQPPRMTWR